MEKRTRKKTAYYIFTAIVVAIYFACVAVLVYQGLTPGNESSNISTNVGNQLNNILSSIHKTEAQKIAVKEIVPVEYTVESKSHTLTDSITLKISEEGKFSCEAKPDDATNKSLTFTSSSPAVISVSADGAFEALSEGVATITASSAENAQIGYTFTVTVEAIPAEGLEIINKIDELKISQKHFAEAEILPFNATYKEIVWESTNSDVASVSANGEILAVSEGQTTIKASLASNTEIFDSFDISVIPIADSTVFAEAVEISFANPEDASKQYFRAKESIQLSATVFPANVTTNGVNWKSSSTAIATVSKTGLVKFLKGGNVSITATSSDGCATAKISFKVIDILPSSIPVTSSSLKISKEGNDYYTTIPENSTAKITAKLSSDTTMKKATFTSSKKAVVEITSAGSIKAKMQGTATVTIACTNKIDNKIVDKIEVYLHIIVVPNEEFVKSESIGATNYVLNGSDLKRLTNNTATIYVGDTMEITPTIYPTNATSQTYSLKSSNSGVLCVDSSYIITGLTPGTATLTFTVTDETRADNDPAPTFKVKVTVLKIDVDSVEINSVPNEMVEDEQLKVSASVYPSNATNQNLIWESSDESILTVSGDTITATSKGEVTLTVRSEDNPTLFASTTITVKPKTIVLTSITPSQTHLTLYRNEQATITTTLEPENATYKGLNWATDNYQVATVTNGIITAKRAGKANVTVYSNTYSEVFTTIEVTVKEIVSKTINLKFKGLSLNENHATIKEKKSASVKAVLEKNATVKTVTYTSSNPDVAKIGNNGEIEAVSPGETVISIMTTDGETKTEVSFTLIVEAISFKDTMSNFYLWVRKSFGHFGAFLVLGIFAALSFILLSPKKLVGKVVSFVICMISGFAIAGITEICQLPVFTAGRHCALSDVILDFTGYSCSAATLFVLVILGYIIKHLIALIKRKNKKEREV